jgi:putative autoinducer-2 (AI-2) aldolase
MVKTYYCDNFEKVVSSCPVPVIIAGGPKLPERDALALTVNALKSGAAGVDMGRNIWQSQYPIPMIRAVRAIVHSNYTLDQAYDLFKKLCQEYPIRNNQPNTSGNNFSQGQKPQQNRPQQNRPQQNRPQQNRPQQNRPQQNQQRPNSPQQNRPQQTRPPQARPQQGQQKKQQQKPQQQKQPQKKPQAKPQPAAQAKPQ